MITSNVLLMVFVEWWEIKGKIAGGGRGVTAITRHTARPADQGKIN